MEAGERWWAGITSESHRMPLGRSSPPFQIDLDGNTAGNQVQPLLVSSTGRYIWSEEPFQLDVRDGAIHVVSATSDIQTGRPGPSLRDAASYASRALFPPSGKMPDPLLFTRPQFNTWIELTYNQNQHDVMAYARAIVANGFEPGVLMIDEGWFKAYGVWDFDRSRFPQPKQMLDELHALGFKVMLWVCPYIRPDGQAFAAMCHDRSRVVWLRSAKDQSLPAIMQWWNGFSAVVDLTSDEGRDWLTAQLRRLVTRLRRGRVQARWRRRRAVRAGGDADGRRGAHALDRAERPDRGVRADRPRVPAERVPRDVEDGRPAARRAPARQGAHLGRPPEARARHPEPGPDGLPVRVSRHDRRRRIPVVREPGRGGPGAGRALRRRSTR